MTWLNRSNISKPSLHIISQFQFLLLAVITLKRKKKDSACLGYLKLANTRDPKNPEFLPLTCLKLFSNCLWDHCLQTLLSRPLPPNKIYTFKLLLKFKRKVIAHLLVTIDVAPRDLQNCLRIIYIYVYTHKVKGTVGITMPLYSLSILV